MYFHRFCPLPLPPYISLSSFLRFLLFHLSAVALLALPLIHFLFSRGRRSPRDFSLRFSPSGGIIPAREIFRQAFLYLSPIETYRVENCEGHYILRSPPRNSELSKELRERRKRIGILRGETRRKREICWEPGQNSIYDLIS